MNPKDLLVESINVIDKNLDKMDRKIKNPTLIDRYLLASTYKEVRFCNAIILLCDNGITDESLPILRSLIEHAINMRWIMEKDTRSRLKSYMNDLEKGFGAPWTDKSLLDRMTEIGFKNRDYFDFCVKLTYSYSHVNASSLVWGEVYDDPRLKNERWSPDAIYIVAAQMMGHVIKALNANYKNLFTEYDYIWNQISVDGEIRKKIEKLKKSIEEDQNASVL